MQFPLTYTVKFSKKVPHTNGIATYYFEKPEAFTFRPGQYNRWTLPFPVTDSLGSSRFFTISSTPLDNKYLTFTTKTGRSGFKKAINLLQKGENITIFGPMGKLTFNDENKKPSVYLSGGMGITPFYSMITYAAEKQSTQSLTLIASFSNENEILYYSELTAIAKKHKNISIIYTLSSQQKQNTDSKMETGRISQHLLKKFIPDLYHVRFYVIGSVKTEASIKGVLTNAGISEENIISEQFTGY